jgi:hypothetical protein
MLNYAVILLNDSIKIVRQFLFLIILVKGIFMLAYRFIKLLKLFITQCHRLTGSSKLKAPGVVVCSFINSNAAFCIVLLGAGFIAQGSI